MANSHGSVMGHWEYLLLQSLDPPTIDPDEIHGRGAAAAMAMGEKRAFFFEENQREKRVAWATRWSQKPVRSRVP